MEVGQLHEITLLICHWVVEFTGGIGPPDEFLILSNWIKGFASNRT
jgi:hypothetical protein